MYKNVKNVIESGKFKLSDMANKIEILWLQGDLTEEQRTELIVLMKENLNPETESPEQVELYKRLEGKYNKLEERVAKLENGGVMPEPPTGVEIPIWEPWDGISNKYQYGEVVTIASRYYISIFKGQNTWEPGTLGTEGLWKEISKENAEAVISGTKTPEQVINV